MPTEPFESAEADLKDLLLELKRVFTGANSAVPDCNIYKTSDAKSRFDRSAHLKLKASMYSKAPSDELITGAKHTYDDLINAGGSGGGSGGGGSSKADKKKPKIKTTHSDPANLGTDEKDGYFIISQQGTASYKLPSCLDCKVPGESFSICRAFYNKGRRCSFGATCKRSRIPKTFLPSRGKPFGTLSRAMKPASPGMPTTSTLVS